VSILDDRYDSRYDYKGGKSTTELPPLGVGATIVIEPGVRYATAVDGKPVAIGALAFHELAESYGRVDQSLTYSAAHVQSAARERTLVEQRPAFTQGMAGVLLERIRNRR
jgi:hypothetical protein